MTIRPDSPLWRAWCAGVFEARITVPKSGAVLRFESTDHELMHNFRHRIGIGSLKNRGRKRDTRYDVWVWYTTNLDDARTVALYVAPLLGNRFTKILAEFVERIERNPHWREKNPEKAASLVVTSPVKGAEDQTALQSTTTDTPTASQTVKPTG